MEGRGHLLPAAAASLACVFGGLSVVASRIAVVESDALSLSVWRQLGGLLCVAVPALVIYGSRIGVARADLLPTVFLAVIQYVGFALASTAAVLYIPAARAALILATMPLATLALAALMGRERPSAAKIAGCLAGLAGIALALGGGAGAVHAEAWKGDLLMLFAMAMGAMHAVLSWPYMRRYSALRAGGLQLVIGLVLLAALLPLVGDPSGLTSFGPRGWAAVGYIVASGGPVFFLWIWALERTTPSRVVITISLNPIAATFGGAWFAGEPVSLTLLAGLAAVVGGIALAYWPGRDGRKEAT